MTSTHQRNRLTVGSLFSGIGGLDLGLERAGMEVRWQSEVDPFCCEVLEKHWPGVPNLGDVTKIEWESVEHVDLICGGFPCQPVSIAGRRLGEDDERWLWPEFLRAVRMVRPRLVLLENVPGLFTAGFGGVAADLAASGYDLEWDCVPAAAVGAPHLRDRLFAVAWLRPELGRALADSDDGGPLDAVRARRDAARDGGAHVADTNGAGREEQRRPVSVETEFRPAERRGEAVADAPCERRQGGGDLRGCGEVGSSGKPARSGAARRAGHVADPDRERCDRRPRIFGTPGWGQPADRGAVSDAEGDAGWERNGDGAANGNHWAAEPAVGRVAHGIPRRVDRLRALGNAVVPQVAEWIGRQLIESLEHA